MVDRYLASVLGLALSLGCGKAKSAGSPPDPTPPVSGGQSIISAGSQTLPPDASDQDKAYVAPVTVDGKSTTIDQVLSARCTHCHTGAGHQGMVMEAGQPVTNLTNLKGKALNLPSSDLVTRIMSGGHMPMPPPFTDGEKQAVTSWLGLYKDPNAAAGPAPAAPTCTVTASPASVQAGDPVTLTIVTAGDAPTVTLQGVAVDSSKPTVVSPVATTSYAVQVSGAGGTGACSADVTVTQAVVAAPTCTLTSSAPQVAPGGQATLTLTVTGTATAGTLNGAPINLSSLQIPVTPNGTTSYAASLVGPGGTGQCQTSITVTVPAGAPTCTLNATAATIAAGASSTLTLGTSGTVTSASIAGQAVATGGGTLNVSPGSTTSYAGSVTGPGGMSTCNATVTVTSGAATCSLVASPTSIVPGDPVTLTLTTSANAASATLNGATVAATGASAAVTPVLTSAYWYGNANYNQSSTVAYAATATSAGGTGNCSVNVTLLPMTQLTQRQAWRAKFGPGGQSVDDLFANPNTCMKCHKTGAPNTAVQPACPVSAPINVVLDATAAPAVYQLQPNNPDANAVIFMNLIYSATSNLYYSMNIPDGTAGKTGTAPTDLHDYLTVKTNSACPVPSGTIQHKFPYYAGFTQAQFNYVKLQWIARWPN